MIIAITEVYPNDQPATWFCDFNRAPEALQKAITRARSSAFKDATGRDVPYEIGCQSINTYGSCFVDPPCHIEDAIFLYCGF